LLSPSSIYGEKRRFALVNFPFGGLNLTIFHKKSVNYHLRHENGLTK